MILKYIVKNNNYENINQLLKAEYINKGSLYIHVGGLEDEYTVPLKAKKIVCDEWEAIKHRSQTISRMYKEGLLFNHNIYANLDELISKNKNGRENNDEFIYFCSVGLPYIDVTVAKYVYDESIKRNIGTKYIIN